jgi:hypothetical protein
MRGASVGACDRRDNCEPQSGSTICAGGFTAAEALECAPENAGCETWPIVEDVQFDPIILAQGSQLHECLAVAQRVVEHVSQRLRKPVRVASEGRVRRRVDFDCSLTTLGQRSETPRRPLEKVGRVNPPDPQRRRRLLIDVREDEQIFGQPDEAFGFFGG